MTAEATVLGTRHVRADGLPKVTGSARYTADLSLRGMLTAKFLYAEHPHARVRSLDTSRARALPGVFAVLTQADLPLVRYGIMVKDRTLMADGVVRFEGEIVAAVAASSPEIAAQACSLIEVDYEFLDPIVDPEGAVRSDSALVHPAWGEYKSFDGVVRQGNSCGYCTIVKGDADAALGKAPIVLTENFRSDMAHPVPIEPRAVVAEWQGEKVTIWSSTQVPYVARAGVAECLRIAEHNVRVVVTQLGGGFGGKCDLHFEPHVAALARAAGRPVRLVFDRAQEFLAPDMRHHPLTMAFATGLTEDGTIVARKARIVLDTGAYAGHGPLIAEIATMLVAGPYRIPNLYIEGHTVYTTRGPSGSVRGPSGPQVCWAVEQHTDSCAERLDMDPVAFRLANLVEEGDEGPTGQRLTSVAVKDCLVKAVELIGERDDLPPGEGVGVAVGWWGNYPMASGASVRLNTDGSATIVTGAQENGSGAVMGLTLLVAEELGLEPEQVSVVYQDTDLAPPDHGSGGSQTTFNNGRAVLAAAVKVRERLLELASEELEIDVSDLVVRGGSVGPVGVPTKALSIAEVALRASWAGEHLVASAAPRPAPGPTFNAGSCTGRVVIPAFTAPSFFAHAARVCVDSETGVVRVLDVAAVHDYGRIINPVGAEGQVEGGIAHGIGIALFEGSQHDEQGKQLNPHLLDYKLPTAADVPDVKIAFVGSPAPDGGPHGLKGVGEAPVIPVAGAVGNAVAHATGSRVRELPMTAERIWASARNTHDARSAGGHAVRFSPSGRSQ